MLAVLLISWYTRCSSGARPFFLRCYVLRAEVKVSGLIARPADVAYLTASDSPTALKTLEPSLDVKRASLCVLRRALRAARLSFVLPQLLSIAASVTPCAHQLISGHHRLSRSPSPVQVCVLPRIAPHKGRGLSSDAPRPYKCETGLSWSCRRSWSCRSCHLYSTASWSDLHFAPRGSPRAKREKDIVVSELGVDCRRGLKDDGSSC